VKQNSEKLIAKVTARTVQYSHFVAFMNSYIAKMVLGGKFLPGEIIVNKMKANVIKS
jgi:hypothetical protein